MSTRHAAGPAPLSQERYMSSPEFVELRGIGGNAVTAKAALMAHPAKKSLLFFLQAMSLAPGGLKQFCRELIAVFPDRIGTPAMHKAGIKPGKKVSRETALVIEQELNPSFGFLEAISRHDADDRKPTEPSTVCMDDFLASCHRLAAALPGFLIELCVNPLLRFSASGEDAESLRIEKVLIADSEEERNRALLAIPDHRRPDWREFEPSHQRAELPWFKDIIGALFEFKRRFEDQARREFVMTEVGRKTFDTLDVALDQSITKKIVLVEGNSGIGKSTALEAWHQQHLGESRLVSLSGISNKTGVFRAIAKALGLASSYARTATEMQARIEDVLQRSRLVLLIDEAHYLLSSAERVYTVPELVNWINTALYNHLVPVALITTPQFRARVDRVEKQTTWNAEQLKRRIKRFCQLPAKPRTVDLENVTRKLLPGASEVQLDYIVG